MLSTMKIRMLKATLVYRVGDILPIVPTNQAIEWIKRGVAEEVVDDQRSAATSLETATLDPGGETASYSLRKQRRR